MMAMAITGECLKSETVIFTVVCINMGRDNTGKIYKAAPSQRIARQ